MHVLIFDSSAIRTSRSDSAISMALAADDTPRWSTALRLFGNPDGDVQRLGFEFNLTGPAGSVTQVPIRWAMEFWNDRLAVDRNFYQYAPGPQDGRRQAAGMEVSSTVGSPHLNWARECVEIVGAAGAVTHFQTSRLVTMQVSTAVEPTRQVCSAYFPMEVHAMWVRLRVWQATGDVALPATHRLFIYGVCGGYAGTKYMEENIYPWDGTANGVLGQ